MRLLTAHILTVSVAVSLAQRPSFEPFSQELSAGATLVNAAADYDRDGDIDLFVGFNGAANRFYVNQGGRLTDVSAAAGIGEARSTRAAAWGDYDADGPLRHPNPWACRCGGDMAGPVAPDHAIRQCRGAIVATPGRPYEVVTRGDVERRDATE